MSHLRKTWTLVLLLGLLPCSVEAQRIVTNVDAAVNTCRQQYEKLAAWVTTENNYQAVVAQANRQKKPTKNIPKPPPPPAKAGPMCPPSTAYGISPDALPTAAPGQS